MPACAPHASRLTPCGASRLAPESTPLVTIAVPVRNGGQHLDEALASLRGQDYPNLDIVVVDNASTDNTAAIAMRHADEDPRVRVLHFDDLVGAVQNFNRGLAEARGEFFMWSAHDDLRQPSYVQRCVETLRAEPRAGLCCTDLCYVNADGTVREEWVQQDIDTAGLSVPERIRKLLGLQSVFAIYGLFRAEAVRRLPLRHVLYGGDNLYVLELALHMQFARVAEPLFCFRFPDQPKTVERYMEDFLPGQGATGPRRPHTQITAELLRLIRESGLDAATRRAAQDAVIDATAFGNPDTLGRLLLENVPGTSYAVAPADHARQLLASAEPAQVRAFVEEVVATIETEGAAITRDAMQPAVAEDASEALDERVQRGEALFAAGRVPEAVMVFREAVAADAGCARAHNGLGVCLWATGRQEEAVASFRRAVEADPGDADAAANLRDALAAAAQDPSPAPGALSADSEPDSRVAAKRRAALRPEQPIDLIFLTHERLDYFQRTLDALAEGTRYPYRVIVVDNASGDQFRAWLRDSAALFDHVILNERNEWTAAFQRGIDMATSDPFIMCDPDILVPNLPGKCWLERLLDLHRDNPQVGLLALNLDPSNKPAKLPDVYIGEKTRLNDEITLGNVGTVMHCIKRRYFTGPYTMDWEVCDQVRRNGGLVGFARNIVAYHLGWDEDRDCPEYLLEKHRHFKETFGCDTYRMYTEDEGILERMGGADTKPYYAYDRPEVRAMLSPGARTVLDVGCASGNLGACLKDSLGAEVWGVEPVADVAAEARGKLDRVLTGGIESALADLPDGYFDAIILADVLEHLADPQAVLEQLKPKLSPRGEIVVSIPNVRHWSVLKDLIEGRWTYADAGILDRTHLRFFTQQTVVDTLTAASYAIGEMRATMLQGCTVPDAVVRALAQAGLDTSTLRDGATHYQYIARAVPRKVAGKASIVVLTWNNLAYTKRCLDSIRRHTAHEHEIIVVDNGSTDGTVEYLRELAEADARYRLVLNAENRGFAGGNNQGIAASAGEYVVLLNNDTVVTDGWLDRMVACAESDPGIGIVGPVSNSISGAQLVEGVEYDQETLTGLDRFATAWAKRNAGRVALQWRVVGFCMLIRRAVIDRIGGLDTRYGRGNFEDDDYCIRASIGGFQCAVTVDSFVHHFGSRTFAAHNIDVMRALYENWEVFKRRWGLPADQPYGQPFDVGLLLRQRYDRTAHYIAPESGTVAERCFVAPDWGDESAWQAIVARYVRAHPRQDGSVLCLYAEGDGAAEFEQVAWFLEQNADNPGECADIEITASIPSEEPGAVILTGGSLDARLRERFTHRCVPCETWLRAA